MVVIEVCLFHHQCSGDRHTVWRLQKLLSTLAGRMFALSVTMLYFLRGPDIELYLETKFDWVS